MMKSFKKLDKYLLLNHQFVWLTRIHYFPFLLIPFGLTQLFFAIFVEIGENSIIKFATVDLITNVLLFIVIIILAIWCIKQARTHKKYFNSKTLYLILLLNLIIVVASYSMCYIFETGYSNRVKNQKTDEEILKIATTYKQALLYSNTLSADYNAMKLFSFPDSIRNMKYENYVEFTNSNEYATLLNKFKDTYKLDITFDLGFLFHLDSILYTNFAFIKTTGNSLIYNSISNIYGDTDTLKMCFNSFSTGFSDEIYGLKNYKSQKFNILPFLNPELKQSIYLINSSPDSYFYFPDNIEQIIKYKMNSDKFSSSNLPELEGLQSNSDFYDSIKLNKGYNDLMYYFIITIIFIPIWLISVFGRQLKQKRR